MKRIFFLTLLSMIILAIPAQQLAHAADTDYIDWTGSKKEYHLFDDVRTITFSHGVSKKSLQPVNGELPVTLWDVTDPAAKQQLSITLDLLEDESNKMTVSLAKGETYKDGHNYSLFIEKAIKPSASSATLKSPIQYDFKMIYKHPENVTFAESYKVTNTADEGKTVEVPKGAYYVVADIYGNITDQRANSTAQSIYMRANHHAFISYLTKTSDKIVPSDGITIEETTSPAYVGKKLYKRNSVQVTNDDEFTNTISYAGNPDAETVHSKTNYPKESNTNHAISEHLVKMKNDFSNFTLYVGGKEVVTNDELASLYVFSPNTTWNFNSIKEIEEEAVTLIDVAAGEKVKIKSNENTHFSYISLRESTNKGTFSYVTYNDAEGISEEQKLNKEVYTFGDDKIAFTPKGDMLLENSGKYEMKIFAPSRFISFEKTDEELFTIHTLKADEKVALTSSDPGNTGHVHLRDLSKRGLFSYAQYNADNTVRTPVWNHDIYSFGDDSIPISEKGETILKNTGKTDQTLYGAKRITTITPTDEEPLRVMTLEPGQSIRATTTENNSYSSVHLSDPSKKGSYSYIATDSNGTREYNYTLIMGTGTATINKDYHTIIKNTGPVAITAFGANRYISFE